MGTRSQDYATVVALSNAINRVRCMVIENLCM